MPRIIERNILVLVANASEAYSYATTRLGKSLELIKSYQHPQSREKGIDLVSDRSGGYQISSTSHYGSRAQPTPPKEIEAERFAHSLVEELSHMLNRQQYELLILIAPPHFLGLLKKYAHPRVLSTVIVNLEKDYTKLSRPELLSHLNNLPRPAALVA